MSISASSWLNFLSKAWALRLLPLLLMSPNTPSVCSIVGFRLCLVEKPTKQQYSFEIKKEVVQRHLAGETAMDLAREFGLSSEQLVSQWSWKWRKGGDDALKPKPKGRPKGSAAPKLLTEEDKLRRQIARLEAENAYLKKLQDLRNQGRA